MAEGFEHIRHQPTACGRGCENLVVACPPMRSNVNLARIVRAAGCLGVQELIVCGSPKIDEKIARDALQTVTLRHHRSLLPVLQKRRQQGYQLVGLEQTTGSVMLHDHRFELNTVLVIGHERLGIQDEILSILDAVVEIPVFGTPHSFNAASATMIAMYEYARQQMPDA